MSNSYDLIEPPAVGGERETLLAFLDYYRNVLARKAAGLNAEQLAVRIEPSTLSLGGLIKHMALVEDIWFNDRLAGRAPVEPWASAPWSDDRDWEINSAINDEPDQLFELFDQAVARSQATIADSTLDDVIVWSSANDQRPPQSLRWILVHMIEEYARHCGHADLLRETIDGATGD